MKTVKLYDTDSYVKEFTAKVISCEVDGNLWLTVLDRTAFFPEAGGQESDKGFINDIPVDDVQIKDSVIYHRMLQPVEAGSEVQCRLDWNRRFFNMQNHTGEHVFSGIAHKMFGCENVGFHLGSEEVTVDFDIELDEVQIDAIEFMANRAVYNNLPVTVEYPDSDKLSTLEYRSKLELTEDVRIVTIKDIDVCACCAPHVASTGEIGLIKVMSFMRHRGGVRIFMKCGEYAVKDAISKQKNLSKIAVALCAKPNETAATFEKFYNDHNELKQKFSMLKKELSQLKAKNIEDTDGNIVLFEDGADMNSLRAIVLDGMKHAGGVCAGFSGDDEKGYTYVIASQSVALRAKSKEINTSLNGKGGGSDEMIQGSVKATREEIEKYFSEV